MALSANRDLTYYASPEFVDLGVDDNAHIYRGAFIGRNRATGYARPLTAGDEFLGIAYREADNTLTGHAAGGISVRLRQALDMVHALAGVAAAHLGQEVYASDDATLTLTPLGNSRIGRVLGVEASGLARVRCQPIGQLAGVLENSPVVELADASTTLTLDHLNRTLLIANSAARTLTLPPVASVRAGGWIRVVKTSAAAFPVTLDANGAELIDGAATYPAIDARYDAALLLCTGLEWVILSRDIA